MEYVRGLFDGPEGHLKIYEGTALNTGRQVATVLWQGNVPRTVDAACQCIDRLKAQDAQK